MAGRTAERAALNCAPAGSGLLSACEGAPSYASASRHGAVSSRTALPGISCAGGHNGKKDPTLSRGKEPSIRRRYSIKLWPAAMPPCAGAGRLARHLEEGGDADPTIAECDAPSTSGPIMARVERLNRVINDAIVKIWVIELENFSLEPPSKTC